MAFNRTDAVARHLDMAKACMRLAAQARAHKNEAKAKLYEGRADSHVRIAETLREMKGALER